MASQEKAIDLTGVSEATRCDSDTSTNVVDLTFDPPSPFTTSHAKKKKRRVRSNEVKVEKKQKKVSSTRNEFCKDEMNYVCNTKCSCIQDDKHKKEKTDGQMPRT